MGQSLVFKLDGHKDARVSLAGFDESRLEVTLPGRATRPEASTGKPRKKAAGKGRPGKTRDKDRKRKKDKPLFDDLLPYQGSR